MTKHYDIRLLTPALWPQLEELFGPTGACNGCWCMYWRIGSVYNKNPRAKNKTLFKAVVKKGPPPGLLAFDGDMVVGWCQVTPRTALPSMERSRFAARVDDVPVWSLSCFYIRKGNRGQGIANALIEAAVKHAKREGAPALEAYPVENEGRKRSSSTMYTGAASSFARAGFRKIAAPAPHRPTMRLDPNTTRKKATR